MKTTKYYLAAITAYTIWGFFSLVLKPIHEYPSLDILFNRVFSCSILMVLIVFIFKRKTVIETIGIFKALSKAEKRKTLLLNFGGSFFLMANWFTFIYVMNHVSVKATSLAYLVCPILTTLLAYFLLHEKLSKTQWISVGLSVSGCLLLSYTNIMDMVFSIVIGLTYAAYLVSQRVNKGFDKFIILTFHISLAGLVLLPFYPVYSGPVPTEFKFYFCIETIAILFTIFPLFLNLYALSGLNSSTVGMLLNINPMIAFALAAFVFNEQISSLQILAYGIIFIAVLVFNSHHLFALRAKYLPVTKNT
ncbi:EamA family transporter [Flavobacterium circumlabens]|uniref:Chloramphenicol-sensitive protein RarD n=1 Tax=Flavobacterium circumlabens TaxID=2133765 RepID=A0A4Y7UF10_9FLAO|nr:EamA family transporter [Flavobacterium circumlabens]TCN59791.1 chloramphenicol-sensitive protein RarD [Flavobacterium circumlabens]TEB45050.1 EamA family transporter [Flavobacterium circumlabens]